MPPVKNPRVMTSYGGIIRIRLKGRSSVTSSQPALQAPLYLLAYIILQLKQHFNKILIFTEFLMTVSAASDYTFSNLLNLKNVSLFSLTTSKIIL